MGKANSKASDLLNGRGSFGAAIARELEEALGLDRFLLDGLEPPTGAKKSRAPAVMDTVPEGTEGDIEIPQFDVIGSMGSGRLLLEDQPGLIKSWRVNHEWIRQNVKSYTSLKNLCIVTGFGNSMKPMYNPGDPLLLDTGVQKVDHEGVFFFAIGDEGFIKQLQRIPDPHGAGMMLRAKSRNLDYDPFDISPANPHFVVLGKILTAWKSEQY